MNLSPEIAAPAMDAPGASVAALLEQVYRMPLSEYHRATELGTLPENVELLRGIVVVKMSKSPLHESIISRLTRLLNRQLPEELMVRLSAPLTLLDSEPEPDLAVVEVRSDDWRAAHPSTARLVIEVAINSVRVDSAKALIYAEAGLPEYWLVRPEEKSVTVYREPGSEGYRSVQRYAGAATLRASEFAFAVELPEIF